MRRFLLYVGAILLISLFYVLQQHMRGTIYPQLMAPMTPGLMDGLFTVIYAVAGLVMFGALFEQIMLVRHKRRRPQMQSALTTAERARLKAAQPKEKVFY